MKQNENIKIIGNKVILVPYEAKHVPKYHEWMKDPELQELTASEPLTLEEEYEMQNSWRNDEDKCTFLILCKEIFEESNDEIKSLIGDTNLFLNIEGDDSKVAEAEIMIAEKDYRGRHLGSEAMLLMLRYGTTELHIKEFIVKIGMKNSKSIKMFERMRFEETSHSEVFREVTLRRIVSNEWKSWLESQTSYEIACYNRDK